MPRVCATDLERFYREAFIAERTTPAAAEAGAAGLLYADLHGIDTHGAANLDRVYLAKIRAGEIDGAAEPQIVVDTNAVALIDAHRCLGFLPASRGMELAVAKAGRFGIGAVAVRNSTHCGALGYYTSLAAKHDSVGIGFTNLGSEVHLRPPNGRRNLLGTNVIAAGSPAGDAPRFNLDMSVAAVAVSRIRAAQKRGEQVRPGWLRDESGREVTDPAQFTKGAAFLQFLDGRNTPGGYKGYGLAILIDILCGVLSGGCVGPTRRNLAEGAGRADHPGVGHFFVALDARAFRPSGDFHLAMDELLNCLVDCPPASQTETVRYSGVRQHTAAVDRQAHGIPVDAVTHEGLMDIGRRHNIAPPSVIEARPA
jgi:LDH2 family malate/lactate/ureidoglycolate dehydrogenase